MVQDVSGSGTTTSTQTLSLTTTFTTTSVTLVNVTGVSFTLPNNDGRSKINFNIACGNNVLQARCGFATRNNITDSSITSFDQPIAGFALREHISTIADNDGQVIQLRVLTTGGTLSIYGSATDVNLTTNGDTLEVSA